VGAVGGRRRRGCSGVRKGKRGTTLDWRRHGDAFGTADASRGRWESSGAW
jgi:hypothetical protein